MYDGQNLSIVIHLAGVVGGIEQTRWAAKENAGYIKS
jgi:hypothetical protein